MTIVESLWSPSTWQPITTLTFFLSICTLILGLFTAFLWWETRKAVVDSRDSINISRSNSEIMKKSLWHYQTMAEAAREQTRKMNLPDRPYLYFDKNATLNSPLNNVNLFIANIGRTSAIIKDILIYCKDILPPEMNVDMFDDSKTCKRIKERFIMWPEQKYIIISVPDFGNHDHIVGRVEFRDVFWNVRWQTFRYDKIAFDKWEMRGGLPWNSVTNPNEGYEEDYP
ncbi:hypothetical protein [Acidibrevibacterium fodinaquatile]|uniref:hypothetical protein n=1 Tax=Acidibrevibacterium fodinaquatile TaxID=1969806 RepID=UPI0013B3C33C|nr:hypothetical protein [Acidibrevibacterium fodinaquatile]